jgi:hypothetical protein
MAAKPVSAVPVPGQRSDRSVARRHHRQDAGRADIGQHNQPVREAAGHHLVRRMRRDARADHAVAAGQLHRGLAHRAAAEERPQHDRVGAAARQPLAPLRPAERFGLRRIAAHAHVLAVRQAPAMQRVLLHRRHHGVARRMHRDGDVAALPFQLARAVGLGADEPQRRAIVVRGDDALALRIERQPGDRRGMLQRLQPGARTVEDMHQLADRAGQHRLVAGMAGDVLDPFVAEAVDRLHRSAGADAAERAVVAARQEAAGHAVGSERQRGTVMHRDAAPRRSGRSLRMAQRAVAQREGRDTAGAVELRRHDEGAQVLRLAPCRQEKLRLGRLAHLNPPGRLRSRGAAAGGSGCGR